MATECAFCQSTANISGEHIWSDWMNRTLPMGKFRITRMEQDGKTNRFAKCSLDMTVPVVCETCNSTWMSDVENEHAKPAMKDLILSDRGALLTPDRLRSIAIFAFKHAVIADHASIPDRQPFFSQADRAAFRQSLAIPRGVQMWLAAFMYERGIFRAVYHKSPAHVPSGFEFYVFTFGAGYLLFQVVGCKWWGNSSRTDVPVLTQGRFWNKFSLPFWRSDGRSLFWPPDKQFTPGWASRFCYRWSSVDTTKLTLRLN